MTLWLDDIQKQSLTFIDNDTRTLTDIRLGAQGIETGTRGTVYFDDFESRRFSYIGTLTDPGVDDPTGTNQAGWFTRTYTYSTTIPHAVTNVTPETGSPDTYSYDANGNMTCRIENGVTYSHTYNAENRASSIAKRSGDCATGTIIESWSFAYDGDGTRVMTAHFTGTQGTPDSTTAYYMGGAYEVKDGAAKKYYSIAGMTVATQDASGLQYLLTDHLGSTVAVTNSSGTLTSQQRYLPFGAPRSIPNSPIAGTDFTYTGQRMLDSGMGGIMDYKARFYSPYINRFLQPDSLIPNPANPQSLNRFGYVLNNPIRFNDPTGHICSDPEDPTPTCDGSASEETRVGDRMVRGSGLGAGHHKKDKAQTDVTAWLVRELDIQAEIALDYYTNICQDDVFCKLGLHMLLFNNGQRYDIKVNMSSLTPEKGVVLCGSSGCRWVDYSVPGNILYGYLSGIVGIPQEISWTAGGMRESADNGFINWDYSKSWFDNPGDKAAVDFGYQLAKDYGVDINDIDFGTALTTAILGSFQSPPSYPDSLPLSQVNAYPPGYFLNPLPR